MTMPMNKANKCHEITSCKQNFVRQQHVTSIYRQSANDCGQFITLSIQLIVPHNCVMTDSFASVN